MVPVEHERTTVIFQQLHVVDGVHMLRVRDRFRIDHNVKVRRHHGAHIFLVLVVERFRQHVAKCFINATKTFILIQMLIHARIHFFLQIVVKVQGVYLERLPNVIIHRWGAVRGLMSDIFITEKNLVEK